MAAIDEKAPLTLTIIMDHIETMIDDIGKTCGKLYAELCIQVDRQNEAATSQIEALALSTKNAFKCQDDANSDAKKILERRIVESGLKRYEELADQIFVKNKSMTAKMEDLKESLESQIRFNVTETDKRFQVVSESIKEAFRQQNIVLVDAKKTLHARIIAFSARLDTLEKRQPEE